jgi:PIN domain nuclease of toxin-antitoxin system
VRQFFEELFSNPAYQPHELTVDQVLLAEEIRVNRDPFDTLICAAARDLELPLVTGDTDIRSSRTVAIIW